MIVAVSGCPREGGVSYTERTVASLLRAGAKEVYVYDDVFLSGSGPACHSLLKELYARFPGEDVLLTEDDVLACKNAIPAVERLQFTDDCKAYSLFTNSLRFCREFPKGIDPDYVNYNTNTNYRNVAPLAGIHLQTASRSFAYAQALKLHSSVIEIAATQDWPFIQVSDVALEFCSQNNIRDFALGNYIGHVSRWIGHVVPNWFQHIGDVSAALNLLKRERLKYVISGNWLGEEHDALTDDLSERFYL